MPRAHHQLLADDVGVAGRFAIGLKQEFGLSHRRCITSETWIFQFTIVVGGEIGSESARLGFPRGAVPPWQSATPPSRCWPAASPRGPAAPRSRDCVFERRLLLAAAASTASRKLARSRNSPTDFHIKLRTSASSMTSSSRSLTDGRSRAVAIDRRRKSRGVPRRRPSPGRRARRRPAPPAASCSPAGSRRAPGAGHFARRKQARAPTCARPVSVSTPPIM